MNKENIMQLADALDQVNEAAPELFHMSYWGSVMTGASFDPHASPGLHRMKHCGSRGCIAGWAKFLFGNAMVASIPRNFAALWLELDEEQAEELFTPVELRPDEAGEDEDEEWVANNNGNGVIYGNITAAIAAKILRNFARTGLVEWEVR